MGNDYGGQQWKGRKVYLHRIRRIRQCPYQLLRLDKRRPQIRNECFREWIATTVDNGGDVGSYTSLTLDLFGNVHISYYDLTNADLKYASNNVLHKPKVITEPATNITQTPTLNATVNRAATTKVWFEGGQTGEWSISKEIPKEVS